MQISGGESVVARQPRSRRGVNEIRGADERALDERGINGIVAKLRIDLSRRGVSRNDDPIPFRRTRLFLRYARICRSISETLWEPRNDSQPTMRCLHVICILIDRHQRRGTMEFISTGESWSISDSGLAIPWNSDTVTSL